MRYLIFVFLFFSFTLQAQIKLNELPQNFSQRKKNLLIVESSSYSLALVGLNQLWYKGYKKSSFHFINDNNSWLQMDKFGHLTTSYFVGVLGIKTYQWAGFSRKQSIWIGGLTGTFFQSAVEILDGFSEKWGASSGDLVANSLGSLLAISQQLYWDEQKILLKYSFNPSEISNTNPQLFGNNLIQKSLKDYNGQTYWLCFNFEDVFNSSSYFLPKWLNLAFGYGADNMYSDAYSLSHELGYRQFFLSLDINTDELNISNKFVKNLVNLFGFIKLPMPTLEYSQGKLIFHNLYY
tara:strand:+ start:8338 stop:9216 length:879 start_codon:yes stop_codon:yes gene_type:complete